MGSSGKSDERSTSEAVDEKLVRSLLVKYSTSEMGGGVFTLHEEEEEDEEDEENSGVIRVNISHDNEGVPIPPTRERTEGHVGHDADSDDCVRGWGHDSDGGGGGGRGGRRKGGGVEEGVEGV